MRFRHADDDLVRSARQQDFLRQAKDQIGLGRLFGDRKELLRIFGRYTDTDLHSNSAILRLLKLAFESSGHPIREVRFRGDIGPEFVTISPDQPRAAPSEEFLHVRASNGSRQLGRGATQAAEQEGQAPRQTARSPGLPPGVIDDKTGGENHVAQAATQPELPALLPAGAARAGQLHDRRQPARLRHLRQPPSSLPRLPDRRSTPASTASTTACRA